MEIKLGEYNTLEVVKDAGFGIYLDGGREGEVLLPAAYVPEGVKPGDKLEVFLYLDSEERLIATTQKPFAKVGDFACLEVAWVNQYGAFLKWGLMKDLFVPFREQKQRMVVGGKYVVYVMVDEESYRIMATAKVDKFLCKDKAPYNSGDEVDILVWEKTELGYKVIVDNKYAGLVYSSEIFTDIETGMKMKAYIRQVREDGKIDVVLQKSGFTHAVEVSDVIMEKLKAAGGKLPFSDKTPAEEIYQHFGVSKKVFKKAIGTLYKSRQIVIEDDGIMLTKDA